MDPHVWKSFAEELVKLGSKIPTKAKVPSAKGGGGQNFGKFTSSPGATPVSGQVAKASPTSSGGGSIVFAGRTGAINSSPPPPPAR